MANAYTKDVLLISSLKMDKVQVPRNVDRVEILKYAHSWLDRTRNEGAAKCKVTSINVVPIYEYLGWEDHPNKPGYKIEEQIYIALDTVNCAAMDNISKVFHASMCAQAERYERALRDSSNKIRMLETANASYVDSINKFERQLQVPWYVRVVRVFNPRYGYPK